MVHKNPTSTSGTTISSINKKKEENGTPFSTPSTHVSLVKSITEETSDSLISASNNAEMSDTISYNKAQRTCHQRRCKAGQVGKDGKIQTNLHAGVSTPDDSFLYSSNNDEMLKSQYTQQELDEIEKHQEYQKQQEMLVQESTQLLKLVAPEIVTENNNEELFTKVCTKCGAIQKVPYKVDKCKFSPDHKLIVYEDESEIKTSKRYDVDSGDEITTFVNIEAEMGLGTRDPEIEQINPYIKTWHYDFRNDLVYGSMKQLYPNKARKSDIERESELINDQICNLANCLNDDSPVLRNWARKVIRLFSKSDDNEVSLVPKTNGHKQVAVNMYKKIIREFGHYIEATYPETPDHLSAKALGVHTWNFQLATKVKQDGKWVAKANVDIDVIMNILKAFSNTEINYPTIELVENEIIMYGDSNQRMSWQDKGKRSGKDGKVVPAWNHDNMRNQAFQHFNMDELVLQSEYEDNTLIDRGVDGMFDGDWIYPVAGETPAPITSSKNTIFVFGSNEKGIHGKGSALEARKNHGAVLGKGVGLQGSSYAIPTKETPYKTLSLEKISKYVSEFVEFAKAHPEMTFNVVAIGCANAGYTPKQIAPLFGTVPTNVNLPESFKVAN